MVSIILCTYNRAHTLKETIDSILAQTYRDFELIIVDDGSTDQTQKLIAEYSDSRIRSFLMDENRFYCAAANFGLTKAKGDYIAFATSDDLWEPRKLEVQINYMETRKNCGACFTFVHLIDENGENVNEKYKPILDVLSLNYFTQKEWIQRFYFEDNCLCHPSSLVRKEVLDRVGGYHLYYSLLADMDLWLRIVRYYPIHVIEEDLVAYRIFSNAGNQLSGIVTEKKTTKSLNEHMVIRKNFIRDLTDEELIEFFVDRFRFKEAYSHKELEIERAFLLFDSVETLPNLNVLGMEKFEELLRDPEYVSILKNTYHIKLQDIYEWNTKHFYMDYSIHTFLGEKDQQIERNTKDIQSLSAHAKELERQREIQKEEFEKEKQIFFEQKNAYAREKEELLREIRALQKGIEDTRNEVNYQLEEKRKLNAEIEEIQMELLHENQRYISKEKEWKELLIENKKKTDLLNQALLEKLKILEKKSGRS